MNRVIHVVTGAILAAVAWSGSAVAELRMPSVFSDHMVLQRSQPLPVWGWADAGASVTVTLGKDSATTKAGADGAWTVELKPIKRGEDLVLDVASGSDSLRFSDVAAGEVWICSGQSNMQWPLSTAADADAEIAAATNPDLRLFYVKRTTAAEPQTDCEGTWNRCTPELAKDFSAVAYFFGRYLQKELGVPVGLIHTSWGGTPAESWASYQSIETDAMSRPILVRWKEILANYPEALKAYEAQLAEYEVAVKAAKEKGETEPRRPSPPMGPDHTWRPATLYNAMIAPLVPFAMQGAIWYQGESNADRAYQYRSLFQTMILDWCDAWEREFPFYLVQLANFRERNDRPVESDWAELREAQTMSLDLPKVGMAVIIDIGEADNIHPKNKQDVGKRLALNALAQTYGKRVVYSGPMFDGMIKEDGAIRIEFEHEGGGLVAKGGTLKGFAIAGEDRNFVWADATIDGDEVVVRSPSVPEPVAVRYGWANNPECTLYNKAGLPASPFRTDKWPGVTIDNR